MHEGNKVEDVGYALWNSSKWKSPGWDNISNFWLNIFPKSYELQAQIYIGVLQQPSMIPARLVNYATFLLPKYKERNEPITSRPLTS